MFIPLLPHSHEEKKGCSTAAISIIHGDVLECDAIGLICALGHEGHILSTCKTMEITFYKLILTGCSHTTWDKSIFKSNSILNHSAYLFIMLYNNITFCIYQKLQKKKEDQ